TLVNHILSNKQGLRVAVIENEYGEVGIDDALVMESREEVCTVSSSTPQAVLSSRSDTVHVQILEMNNGCICCTVRGDLIRILGKLARRKGKLDSVLIETTGLANPGPVIQTFFVDDNVKVAFGDKLLLNKVDLVTAAEKDALCTRLRKINAGAKIIECQHSKVDLGMLLGVHAFSLDSLLERDPDFLHDDRVSSVGIEAEGSCNMQKLNEWLSKLLQERGVDLFRSKGVLSVAGSPHKHVFQGVHMLLQ
ncbi:predicted protein, partial [Haematococcus lacustris]